jgi:hypothetical protein
MKRSVRGMFARGLATVALVGLYGLGMIGASSFAGVQTAQARGRGGFRGGRGSRGRGRGIFLGAPYLYGGYDDGCYWSPARGRWVCPYYYSPYRYYW